MYPTTLAYLLLAFITGIYFQKQFSFAPRFLLPLALTSLACFLPCVWFKKKQFILFLVSAPLLFLVGSLALTYQIHQYTSEQKRIINKKGSLLARAIDKKNNIITLRLQKPYSGKVWCRQTRTRIIKPGDLVRLQNVTLTTPQDKGFLSYAIKENILGTISLKKSSDTIIPEQSLSLKKIFLQKRSELYSALQKKIPPLAFQYFSSIFLGNKEQIPEHHNFYYWGTSHHLARSGLHIALFIMLWSAFFALLPIPLSCKNILLSGICLTYALLSWTSTSFFRAISIFLLYQLGSALNRQPNLLYLLQLIAFTTLVTNPSQLFFLDFQLSFGITAALAWGLSRKTP
ncbi:ComEC/Rec2 family competence protein [Candidatus Dependentiae bacterium]|nr:ComEC/Rec2 family competence protein [Candidatus Dependentiae bacterium]